MSISALKALSLVTILVCFFSLPETVRANEIDINGFASFYAVHPLTQDPATNSYGQHPDYTSGDVFGLNLHTEFVPQWEAIAQVVVSGAKSPRPGTEPDWKPVLDWFYVTYRPSEAWSFRVGRQLYPLWMVSEFQDAGFTYIWREPPSEVYALSPFKAFNGLSAESKIEVGGLILTSRVFAGQEKAQLVYSTVDSSVHLRDMLGVTVTLDGDGWRLRAMATRSTAESSLTIGPTQLKFIGKNVQTTGAGFRYDKHGLIFLTEYGQSKSQDGTIFMGKQFLEGIWGAYGTLGYRMGSFVPHYTYATGSADFGLPFPGGRSKTHTLGLNYQFNPSIIMKTEIAQVIAEEDAANLNGTGSSNLFSTGIDLVF